MHQVVLGELSELKNKSFRYLKEETMNTYDELILKLQFAGEHKKVKKLAALIAERYKEDLRFDDLVLRYNGKCGECSYTFQEGDCQHEVKNIVACDNCYGELTRPITLEDLEDC
jgi:hypothetical protein